jgi:hypothetical protein
MNQSSKNFGFFLLYYIEISEDENMRPNCLFCKAQNMQVVDVEANENVNQS